MYKRIWLFCKNFLYIVILVFFISLLSFVCFKNIICNNIAKRVNGVKYDVVVNNIQYYSVAKQHRYIFPPELNEMWDIQDFHYYSYREEKYEIALYVLYNQEEYDKEISRLNKDALNYNYTIKTVGDIKKYIFKCDTFSELYEYAIADEVNKCIFYAYSYGIASEYSTINRKYML